MSPSAIDSVTNALAPSTPQASSTQTPALFSLAKKTIAITGGGRGLGITLASAVVEAGGYAACLDILPEPSSAEWEALSKLAKQSGTTVSYRQCDVTSEKEVTCVLEEISKDGDQVGAPFHGMVACAGIQQRVPALEYEASDFERILRVNVVGAFISVKQAAKILEKKGTGGSLVLIASMSGQIANRVCIQRPTRVISISNVVSRGLHALHITPASQQSTRCADHSRKNGDSMAFG
jgi:NAD(P)-dependent dehydrogenase (short-subunit alcohol dehydrogenase family)